MIIRIGVCSIEYLDQIKSWISHKRTNNPLKVFICMNKNTNQHKFCQCRQWIPNTCRRRRISPRTKVNKPISMTTRLKKTTWLLKIRVKDTASLRHTYINGKKEIDIKFHLTRFSQGPFILFSTRSLRILLNLCLWVLNSDDDTWIEIKMCVKSDKLIFKTFQFLYH